MFYYSSFIFCVFCRVILPDLWKWCQLSLGLFVPHDICLEIEKHVGVWDGSHTNDEVYEICGIHPGKLRCMTRNTYGPFLYNFPRMGVLGCTFYRKRRYRLDFCVAPLKMNSYSNSGTTNSLSQATAQAEAAASSSPDTAKNYVGVIGADADLSGLGFANWRVQYSIGVPRVQTREKHVLEIDVQHPDNENSSRSYSQVTMTHNGEELTPCRVYGTAVRLAAEATSTCEISILGITDITPPPERSASAPPSCSNRAEPTPMLICA